MRGQSGGSRGMASGRSFSWVCRLSVFCIIIAQASCFQGGLAPFLKHHGGNFPPLRGLTRISRTSMSMASGAQGRMTRRFFVAGAAVSVPLAVQSGEAAAKEKALTVAERDELYRKAKEEETKSMDSTKLPDETATKLFREAQRAQQTGDVPKALKLTNELIEAYPGFAYGWSNRGNLYVAKQEYDKAVSDYSKAIELAPSGKETWVILLNRGTTLALTGKDEEGIADFTEALKLPPTMGPSQEQILKVNRALIEMKVKDWAAALKDLDESHAISPKQPDIWWLQYALLKFQVGQDDVALQLLTEANKRLPRTSDVSAALAALATERGDRDSAETFWADVQRPKKFSSLAFLDGEKHWPPRAINALKKFRGSKFEE